MHRLSQEENVLHRSSSDAPVRYLLKSHCAPIEEQIIETFPLTVSTGRKEIAKKRPAVTQNGVEIPTERIKTRDTSALGIRLYSLTAHDLERAQVLRNASKSSW